MAHCANYTNVLIQVETNFDFYPVKSLLGEGTGSSPSVTVFLSDGMLDVSHDGVRRRVAVRAGDAFWLEARTGLRVVSDHPVGAAIVQIHPRR